MGEICKMSAKKLFELILSAKEPSENLNVALQSLLRRAIESPQYFDFLLHRVDWFGIPLNSYHQQLEKLVRFYRGRGKQAAKVVYNLLTQALALPKACQSALKCMKNLFEDSYDKKIIMECIKENYPHKLHPQQNHLAYLDCLLSLCSTFPQYRVEFLELIVEKLAAFDTELLNGDQWVCKPFVEDGQILSLRQSNHSELYHKFDALLLRLLQFLQGLSSDQTLLKELFLVFQNKILPIKGTKMIQYILFLVAETSKSKANEMISFLLGSIFNAQTQFQQNWYRIYTQSHFYLISYVSRSKKLSQNSIARILKFLLEYLRQKLENIQEKQIDEKAKLSDIFYKNEKTLYVLQSLLMISFYCPNLNPKIQEEIEQMIKLTRKRFYFQYFLKDDILDKLNLKKDHQNKNRITLKYSNKFIPMILIQAGQLIDPIYKYSICQSKKVEPLLQEYQKKPSKRHKGQTPLSLGSDTGI